MKDNRKIHNRRSIRLKGYDYSQIGAYFVTICTHNREFLFGNISDGKMILNDYGKIVEQCWYDLPNHYNNIELHEFVVMPNHFHGIISIVTTDNTPVGAIHESPLQLQRRKMLLPKIIGRLKMNTAKQINIIRNTPGIPVWQRNYYEHIIRDDESFYRISKYIINNPINWEKDDYYA
ncbi:MAG: transposase [Spirochaetota bacterium]